MVSRILFVGFGALLGLVAMFRVEGEWDWWNLLVPPLAAWIFFYLWFYVMLALSIVFTILNTLWRVLLRAYHAIVDAEIRRRKRNSSN